MEGSEQGANVRLQGTGRRWSAKKNDTQPDKRHPLDIGTLMGVPATLKLPKSSLASETRAEKMRKLVAEYSCHNHFV